MIQNHEWLTRNTLRSFPLIEDVRAVATNTGWTLPNFLLADISLIVPEAEHGLYVSAVTITPRIISIIIASVLTGKSVALATSTRDISPVYERVEVRPLADGVSGTVTFGSALEDENFAQLQQHQGLHSFDIGVKLETKAYLDTGLFPVRSLSIFNAPQISGSVSLKAGERLTIDASVGDDNGDPLTFLVLNLVDPTAFLSPCESGTTPCECPVTPIYTINGVTGDVDHRITIEIVDEDGNVYLLAPGILSFTIIKDGTTLCERPVMPDAYGRLPNSAGAYFEDAPPPLTSYQAPGDTTFPLPTI